MNIKHFDFIAAQDRASRATGPGPGGPTDLYLAPHCDDICFSLGGHAAARGQGQVLVLFSRSNYMINGNDAARKREDRSDAAVDAVSATRRAEEEAFATQTGLTVTFSDLDDAPLRGRGSVDVEPAPDDATRFTNRLSDEEAARLGPEIMEQIRAATGEVEGDGSPVLYCPIGVGRHLDHLIVRTTVLAHLEELQQTYEVAFYEDLRYASRLDAREAGLRDFFVRARPRLPYRRALPIADRAAKRALVNLYPSQFRGPVKDLREFIPASREHGLGAHEAVWLL